MTAGGARPGAGRKKNTPNKATAERRAKAEAGGKMPLEVLLEDMRYHYQRVEDAISAEAPAKETDEQKAAREQAIETAWNHVRPAATKLMPYFYPQLSTVKVQGGGAGTDPVKTEGTVVHKLDPKTAAIVRKMIE